ncbi:hypothetical protein JCM5353_007050 [Sporobolomyces roseus]
MEVQRRHLVPLPPLPRPPLDLLLPSSSSFSRDSAPLDPHLSAQLSSIAAAYSSIMESRSREGLRENYPVAISRLNFKGGGQESSDEDIRPDYGRGEGSGSFSGRKGSYPGKALEQMVILSKHPKIVEVEIKHHAAVLVVKNRNSPELVVESMPFLSRLGCQLLYHGVFGHEKLLDSDRVEKLFRKWSKREGRRFDSPINPLHRIQNYIRAYHVDCSDLLEPDLSRYPTLNSFFFRKLRDDARPITDPSDPSIVSSAADCRLTVFPSIKSAEKLWIKGRHFTLEQLLGSRELARTFKHGCVAIFRLAPADYHRYHCPVDHATVGTTDHLDGKYYTVNSLIVRDTRFNPLGENKRDVTLLHCDRRNGDVAFVQIGALLVSSIRQTQEPGTVVARGGELGYFAYGGSTIVAVFERDSVEWDEDLLRNSAGGNDLKLPLETKVKMGERIGTWRT